MRTIPSSELIINDDGSIFHLHLRPEQLADTVILVGDPGRVELVASFFDTRECNVSNREFNTVTGTYKGKRMTVLSTGIGIGNIDISVTELDALANVDFETRQVKPELRRLTLLRLGTSGAIQPDIKVGEAVFSRMSIGFDGLLNYYKGRNEVCNLEYEQAFMRHTGWSDLLPKPYFAVADEGLFDLFRDSTREGITIAAPGFYAPQGRWVRLRAPEREDRIVRVRRPPHHQLRDGELGARRHGLAHGAPRRDDLHDHRTAHRAGRLHRLQTVRQTDDPHGTRQAGDDLIRTNASISRIIKIIETQHEIFRIKFRASVAAGDHR